MAVHLGYAPATQGRFYHQSPRAPPSPPMEDARCSLPSISNLLGLADAGSPTTDPLSTLYRASPPGGGGSSRPGSRQSGALPHQPRRLPPTPPLSTDASHDGGGSNHASPRGHARGHFSVDSASSTSSSLRFHETTPPLESETQQRHPHDHHGPPQEHAHRLAPQPPQHHGYHQVQVPLGPSHPPRLSVPAPASRHYTSAPLQQQQQQQHHHHHHQALQQHPQHLHPQAYPPSAALAGHAFAGGHEAHPHPHPHALWQHHHYLHPSQGVGVGGGVGGVGGVGGGGYPTSQDKYLCPTCNKAFSRPSSLRIHSHSHTGEKPYRCAHPGCGKAFSVRSNMKRHERGCHSLSPMER